MHLHPTIFQNLHISARSSKVVSRPSTLCCLYHNKKIGLYYTKEAIKADVNILRAKSSCV